MFGQNLEVCTFFTLEKFQPKKRTNFRPQQTNIYRHARIQSHKPKTQIVEEKEENASCAGLREF
jgi:hypothetical protein